MGERLTNDHKLLIKLFIDAYGAVEPKVIKKIEEDMNMTAMANTPTQYFIELGEERGEKRGEERGEKRGELRGVINYLQGRKEAGLISELEFQTETAPLFEKLALLNENTDITSE